LNRLKSFLQKAYQALLIWRIKKVKDRNLILTLSFVIGVFSGLSAVLLKNTVRFTEEFVFHYIGIHEFNYLFVALPLIGILLTVLFVRFVVKDNLGHGVSKVLFSISKNKGYLKPHNNYSSLVASTLTVGFGGPVGLEAPIVLTGSSLGSSLGRFFRLNYKQIILLIGCGAAGAVAGIFKAPMAAFVFAIEVLLLDLTMWSVTPLLISSATAASLSHIMLGNTITFPDLNIMPFSFHNAPFYVILGVFCGIIAWYVIKINTSVESRISRINNPIVRILLGGILIGLIIFAMPPIFGEGYQTLRSIFSGNAHHITDNSQLNGLNIGSIYFLGFLLLLILFKVIAVGITNGAGGIGGVFAPSLFIGGISGLFISTLFDFLNIGHLPEINFTLAGMAGVMAAVMHAPLTAIFLIAEISGGYELFIPLIITTTVAFTTIKTIYPFSIYTRRLALRGELITHNKDQAMMVLLDVNELLEKDFEIIKPNDKLEQVVQAISKSRRNVFPVVDDNGQLAGIIELDSIRNVIFNQKLYGVMRVQEMMIAPPAIIDEYDTTEAVLKSFDETGAWNLPVIKQGKYQGFISKSRVLTVYRQLLKDTSNE